MIDFRYHLVTIIAIFLALAIGIVVGTTALNGAAVTDLHRNVARLESDKAALSAVHERDQARLALGSQFAAAVEPRLVRGRLSGDRVALVGLPGSTSAERTAMAALLRSAGADVVSQLAVRSDAAAAGSATLLATVAQDAAPSGVTVASDLPPVDQASMVLASALAERGPGSAIGSGSAALVLAAFTRYHLIRVERAPSAPAPLVLLLAGPAAAALPATPSPSATAALGRQDSLTLALARAFAAAARGVELAGPASAGQNGLVAAVRADQAASAVVTTTDGSDTPQGQVAVVEALRAAARGQVGAYGVAPGETPLPSPSPTATPTATPTSAGGGSQPPPSRSAG